MNPTAYPDIDLPGGPAAARVEIRPVGGRFALQVHADLREPGGGEAFDVALDMVQLEQAAPWFGQLTARGTPEPAPAWGTVVREDESPFAGALAGPPGPSLLSRLAGMSMADADDHAVVEAIAGLDRVAAWASALQARAMTELHARRETVLSAGPAADRATAAEIGARLRLAPRTAERRLGTAVALDLFPAVADALAAGRTDSYRARILCEAEPSLPPDERRRVHAGVLPEIECLTAHQIRARLRRAALRTDPHAASARRARAYEDRTIIVETSDDSMCRVTAYVRADHGEAVRTVLDALATHRPAGDRRTADQRRADAFVDVFSAILDRGTDHLGLPLPTVRGRRPDIQVTVSAGTLLGIDDEPAELSGYGLIPADLAREIAADGTWRALVTDANTGELVATGTRAYRPGAMLAATVMARDRTCTFPGCRVPATRCDIDHIDEYDPAVTDREQTTAENLHCACRTHHNLKTAGVWDVTRDVTGAVRWHSPSGHVYTRPLERPPGPHQGPDAGPDAGDSPTNPDGGPARGMSPAPPADPDDRR